MTIQSGIYRIRCTATDRIYIGFNPHPARPPGATIDPRELVAQLVEEARQEELTEHIFD